MLLSMCGRGPMKPFTGTNNKMLNCCMLAAAVVFRSGWLPQPLSPHRLFGFQSTKRPPHLNPTKLEVTVLLASEYQRWNVLFPVSSPSSTVHVFRPLALAPSP